eukprot:m.264814 g.264814  ORF g.264814 m.264814 type:complete len:150 (+) comp28250_c0_seq1:38-487(+)
MSSVAGYHEVQYDDGDIFAGEWNAEGKREGSGVLTFADGSKYSGNFVNGMCQGLGVLVFPDSSKYEGEFHAGKYHGSGVYQRADGMKFEGEFREGQVRGSGLLTFADGTSGRPRQEGDWQGYELVRRANASAAVRKAQEVASLARANAK